MSGVGDYALLLGRGLCENYGWHSTFAVAHPNLGQREHDGFEVTPLEEHSGSGFAANLKSFDCVLLHYVGYGYQQRGCPHWLLLGLRRWKRENPNAHLATMFHELYAFGRPWQSSFWTSPLQQWICRELARISDGIVTNREESAEILRRMTQRDEVFNLPVFSSMGEPHVSYPLVEREPLMVLFGGKDWRTTAFIKDRFEIEAACHKWGIKKIIEIGAGQTPEVNLNVPVLRLGRLSAEEVSIWMSRCRLGFVSYLSSYLEKSSIFAAYAAHGVVPVLPKRAMIPKTLGVIENRQYVCVTTRGESMEFLEERSRDVYAWYQGHCSRQHTKIFANLLRNKV